MMWYIVADIVAVTTRRLLNVNAVARHFSLLPLFVERKVDNNVTRNCFLSLLVIPDTTVFPTQHRYCWNQVFGQLIPTHFR